MLHVAGTDILPKGEAKIMGPEKGYWQRTGPGRMSRRRVLGSITFGATGLAAAALGGCAPESQPAAVPSTSTQPQAPQPKRGGVLRRMNSLEVTFDLDPHTETPAKSRGLHLIYSGLVGYHPENYTVEPDLAQRWEQPDNVSVIFRLQPGVKWQNKPPANGRALTVDDVVTSLERVRTNEPRFQSRALLQGVKIEAPDSSTIKLTTPNPDAGFINKVTGDHFCVLAADVVARAGKFTEAEAAVGTGPFILKSRAEGIGAEYERNPDYFKPGLPYLDGIRTTFFAPAPPDSRAFAAFLAGQLDVVAVPGIDTQKYIASQGPGYSPLWYKADSMFMATPNVEAKPMDDARVTKALRLLIDHEEMKTAWLDLKIGKGVDGAFIAASIDSWDLKPEEWKNILEWKQPKTDAAREALSLLSAAGFTRDNPLKFELVADTGPYGDSSELLQAQWRQLSQGVVAADLRRVPAGPVQDEIRTKRLFSYMVVGNGGLNEMDAVLTNIYRSDASRNFWGYKDATLDGMIDRQRQIFDNNQRKAAIREINLHMIDKHPGVSLGNRLHLSATTPNVRNFYPELWMYGRVYDTVWLDS
jgi:peptide/nickel transport system substrate-binding protein